MKKGFLWVLASVMLLSSCNKDDMTLLRDPYRVQGELSPSFGLPVISSGQLNLNDLLTSFDGTFAGLITADNTITFHYDTSIRETINIGGMVTKKSHASKMRRSKRVAAKEYAAPFISRDTVIEYTLPIDFFDKADMQSITDAGMSINELRLNLAAFVSGTCPENVDSVLRAYVSARFDNLTIQYTGHDYQTHTFTGFASQSLQLNDIIGGGTLTFDSVNLAAIVNSMPRSITAGFHLHVEVDSGLVLDNLHNMLTDTSAITSFSILLDSLRMTSLTFGADLDVKLPFEVRINGLPYSYDLALRGNDGGNGGGGSSSSIFDQLDSTLNNLLGDGAVSMDSSKVAAIIKFSNGIPLDLTLSGTLVDNNDQESYVLFANEKIASAITGPVENRPGVVEAIRDSATVVNIDLTVEALERLTEASKLRLRLVLATADFASDPNFRMIKRDDYLKVKMMIKLDPKIDIDMQVFDGFGNMLSGVPVIGGMINN
ncbi:MAG: hypothetical protein J6X79_02875 [Bacteroidales bacterium]|nr:hypothetical protein [Bacteroidales bacterium]